MHSEVPQLGAHLPHLWGLVPLAQTLVRCDQQIVVSSVMVRPNFTHPCAKISTQLWVRSSNCGPIDQQPSTPTQPLLPVTNCSVNLRQGFSMSLRDLLYLLAESLDRRNQLWLTAFSVSSESHWQCRMSGVVTV